MRCLPPVVLKQPLVGAVVPIPVETGLGERRVEGAAMDALGLGQRAVDVEDQDVSLCDPILGA